MIDKFFNLFKGQAVHKIGLLTSVCSQVIRTFDQEFGQDLEARNMAIETMIELLQKQKSLPPTLPIAAEINRA